MLRNSGIRKYNASQVEREISQRDKAAPSRGSSRKARTRKETLDFLINMTQMANNNEVPDEDAMSGLIDGWDWLLSDVPTEHLEPVYRFLLRTRTDTFPIKPTEISAAWNDRYVEEEGRPPEQYSWARDEHGNFVKNERVDGVWPLGGTSPEDERARAKAEENKWLEGQGLPPRWPEGECNYGNRK